MNYDIDYFIRKFEAIPEEKWCTNQFHNGNQSCALGHCGLNNGGDWTDEASVLWYTILPDGVTKINDGDHSEYAQDTPKQRILAALQDAKKNYTKKVDHK